MAVILRGKRKGDIIEMHQFCNDWVMSTEGKIHGITSLEFTDVEIIELKTGDTGIMFQQFTLSKGDTGSRFKKAKVA